MFLPLADDQELVGGHVLDCIGAAVGIGDFDAVDGLRCAQAEVDAQVAVRKVAGRAVDCAPLALAGGLQTDASADSVAIVFAAKDLHHEIVSRIPPIVAQQSRRVVEFDDEKVDITVVVVVAKAGATADFGLR